MKVVEKTIVFETRQIGKDELKKEYPDMTEKELNRVLKNLEEKGLVEIEGNKLFLTKDGMELMDYAQKQIDERDKDVV